jgi:hypothetical protein
MSRAYSGRDDVIALDREFAGVLEGPLSMPPCPTPGPNPAEPEETLA